MDLFNVLFSAILRFKLDEVNKMGTDKTDLVYMITYLEDEHTCYSRRRRVTVSTGAF